MKRFTPLSVGSHTLKNRIVVPPMASQTADTQGFATCETINHYKNLAESRAGLVMVEYSFVHTSGKSEPNQLGAHSDACIPGMTGIADAIHSAGAKAGFQLTHCGGKAQLDVCPNLMAPSGIEVPAYDRCLPKPQAMSVDDMLMWENAFVTAARRVDVAGFDFVELHCAHGYGLNQVLSPITNKRADHYGGTLINRARLILNIIQKIRETTSLGILVRIPGQDLYPEGLTQQDIEQTCRLLIGAGVDMIDVSSGIGGWNRPKGRRGEGYLVPEATYLSNASLGVPVIGVGGIETVDYIEQSLLQNRFDLAAVGRNILRDPKDFAARVMTADLKACAQ